MNVTILGSGSKGNALVIECEEDRILVDAGFAPRTLVKRLRAARIAPESISALVLTHEHGDHVAGARVAARRYGWTVYATAGTLAQMPELADANPVAISPRESLQLDTMRVSTVRIPHDAVEPVAVCVESRSTGARCAVAYDIGHVTGTLQQALGDLDAVILESNHDVDLLRTGPYPRALQRRISGGKGHLSNTEAARLAADIVHRGLGKVILAHLSDQNNTPEVARRTVARELRRAGYSGALDVAPQETVTRFSVSRSRRVQQIDLF